MKTNTTNCFKRKSTNNLLIRIFVRILLFSTIILFISNVGPKNSTVDTLLYYRLSFVYYFLFLLLLDRYIQYSNRKLNNQELFITNGFYKLLNFFKWLLVMITLWLMVLTVTNMQIEWPIILDQKILYVLIKIFPNLFGTNISFIIITMLVFYATSIVSINKELKQEQDLTI